MRRIGEGRGTCPVLDLDDLGNQVLHNCAISDARFAGHYSVCGLALRLRDLYKWEKGLEPWVEEDATVLLEWIGRKQEEWEELAPQDFRPLVMDGTSYDPFDIWGINGALEPYGLFYGAGYAHSLKPTFFLARLEETRQVDGYPVYILGREFARDLITVPTLSRDDRILVRRESARLFLWNQIFFIRKSGRDALIVALNAHGLGEPELKDPRTSIEALAGDEIDSYIYHELGEIRDTVFERAIWREMIAAFPHTPVELLARTAKDMLADTNEYGRLRHIIRHQRTASLALYAAFLDGLRKELFPELGEAFRQFTETGNWRIVEEARMSGFDTARHHTQLISRIFREGREAHTMEWVEKEIQAQLLAPLGIVREQPA
jgi:hypothetical protein